MTETWIPLISALITAGVGGILLRVVGHWIDRKKIKFDQDAVRRQELREENADLRKESMDWETKYRGDFRDNEAAIEQWKNKYYELRDEYYKFQFETMQKIQSLNAELERCESVINERLKERDE